MCRFQKALAALSLLFGSLMSGSAAEYRINYTLGAGAEVHLAAPGTADVLKTLAGPTSGTVTVTHADVELTLTLHLAAGYSSAQVTVTDDIAQTTAESTFTPDYQARPESPVWVGQYKLYADIGRMQSRSPDTASYTVSVTPAGAVIPLYVVNGRPSGITNVPSSLGAFSLTVPESHGSVTPERLTEFANGSPITITATPASGYGFVRWGVMQLVADAGILADYTPREDLLTDWTRNPLVNPSGLPADKYVAGEQRPVAYVLYPVWAPAQEIVLAVSGQGATNPSGTLSLGTGARVPLVATPGASSTFASWSATGGSFSGTPYSPSVTYIAGTGAATVTARFKDISAGLGAVYSAITPEIFDAAAGAVVVGTPATLGYTSPTGTITLDPTAQEGGSVFWGDGTVGEAGRLYASAPITLRATPADGYTFTHWSGSLAPSLGSFTDPVTTLSSVVAGTLRANFTRLYTVRAYADGRGTVSAPGMHTVSHGGIFTLSATPAAGAQFVGWKGPRSLFPSLASNALTVSVGAGTGSVTPEGTTVSSLGDTNTSPNLTVTITSDTEIRAVFATNASPTYPLTATPATGFQFERWVVSGGTLALPESSASNAVTGTGEITATAHFKPVLYPITVTVNGGGTTDKTGTQLVEHGSTFTVTAAAGGQAFLGWSGDLPSGLAASRSRNHSLSVTSTAGGSTQPSGVVNQFHPAETLTFTVTGPTILNASFGTPTYRVEATAHSGYQFIEWVSSPTATISDPKSAVADISGQGPLSVTASFSPLVYTYSVTVVGPGSVSPASGAVKAATPLVAASPSTVTATPDYGSVFVGWSCPLWSGIRTENPLLFAPTANTTLTATFAAATFTLTRQDIQEASSGARTSLASQATALPALQDALLNIPASIPEGYAFSHWEIAPAAAGYVDSAGSQWVRMSGDVTAAAILRPKVTLHLAYDGPGTTSLSRSDTSVTYAQGSLVTLELLPSTGAYFDRWTGDKANLQPTNNPLIYTLRLTDDTSLIAHFRTNPRLTVTALHGSTDLPADPSFTYGQVVTFTVTPNHPYEFASWGGANAAELLGSGRTVSLRMDGDKTLTANFTRTQYALTLSAAAGGTVSPESGPFDAGLRVPLVATPSPGYAFAGWTGTGVSSVENPAAASTVATMVGPIALQATFAPISPLTSLRVNISPAAAANLTFWRIVNDASGVASTWRTSGDTVTNLEPGNYTLRFAPVEGYLTPPQALTLGASAEVVRDVTLFATNTQTAWGLLDTVKLTAAPAQGYVFDSWTGRSAGELVSVPAEAPKVAATLLLNGPKEVGALFAGRTYTLTVKLYDQDLGILIPGTSARVHNYPAGQSVTLTSALYPADPGPTYRQVKNGIRQLFAGPDASAVFYAGSAITGTALTEGVTMTRNLEVWVPYQHVYALQVAFDPPLSGTAAWTYIITGGSVSGGPQFASGSVPDVTVTPNAGYAFKQWSGPDSAKVQQPFSTTTPIGPFTRDLQVTAVMEAKTFTLTLRIFHGDTLVSATTTSHPANAALSIPLPERPAGHIFGRWGTETNATAGSTPAPLALTLTKDSTVSCHFVPGRIVTVASSPAAAGTAGVTLNGEKYTGPVALPASQRVQLSATNIPGYSFDRWMVGGEATASAKFHVPEDGTSDYTATVNYTAASYTLTINSVNGATPAITATFPSDTVVSLVTANGTTSGTTVCVPPAGGYTFDHWSGADLAALTAGNTPSTVYSTRFTSPDPKIVMTGDRTLTANFVRTLPITLTNSAGGTTRITFLDPPRASPQAYSVTLTDAAGTPYHTIQYLDPVFHVGEGHVFAIEPHFFPGYQFDRWEGLDPDLNPKTGGYLMVAKRPMNIRAVFVETSDLANPGNSATGPDDLLKHAVLWYRSDTLPDAPDGTSISTWPDSSGNNRTAVQSTPSLQPKLYASPGFNYRRVLRFDGQGATMAFPAASNIRVLFVAAQSRVPGARNILGHTSKKQLYAGEAMEVATNPFGGTSIVSRGPSLVGADSAAGLLRADVWVNATYYGYQGESNVIKVQASTSPAVYTFSALSPFEANQITGQPGNGKFWDGDYAEILAFDRPLSLSEVFLVQNYLYNRYSQKKYLFQTHSYGGTVQAYGTPLFYGSWLADRSAQANGRAMPIAAVPRPGFEFVGWSGDSGVHVASPTSAQTTVRISHDPTHVHATFVEKPANLTLLPLGTTDAEAVAFLTSLLRAEFLQVDVEHSDPALDALPPAQLPLRTTLIGPGGTYTGGQAQRASLVKISVNAPVTQAAGFVFSHWSGASASLLPSTTAPAVELALDPAVARELFANFVVIADPNSLFTITTSTDGHGTVSPSVTGRAGTTQTFTATPNPGKIFGFWSGSHASLLSNYRDATATLVLTSNGTLRANFVDDLVMLATVSGSGGAVSPDGNNLFPRHSLQTITATPEPGYTFAYWTGDIGGATPGNPVLQLTLDAAKTVKAHFRIQYRIDDMFGLTVKQPTESWAGLATSLSPSILAGNALPQKGTSVSSGDLDILPNWLYRENIDGTPVVEWRKHYWTHLTGKAEDGSPYPDPTTSNGLHPLPFLVLKSNTIPSQEVRLDLPVIEVADDPVVLDVPSPGLLYVPNAQTPEQLSANRYFVLAEANGLPSPTAVDGVKDRSTHTKDIPGRDGLAGNEDTFRLTAAHPASLAEINSLDLAYADLEVTPASAKQYLSISADGQHLDFNPPWDVGRVLITYYATLTRGTGLLDPENMRERGLARAYQAPNGSITNREPCWKNSEGYITCWGQLRLTSTARATDPMELGAQVRGTAPRTGDFALLYNRYINDIYPGGERVSGVSAYYILRTIACYFIPGTVSKASAAYECEGTTNAFAATAGSSLCDDPDVNGYQRCIDGHCTWYAFVPANISCQPSVTLTGNWDPESGTSGSSSFVSLVGTTVRVDQAYASGVMTCVALPCPKRTADCTAQFHPEQS